MTANVPVREADAGDLVKFRSENQWGKWAIAIQHPATVYSARINQTFDDGVDGIYEFAYDGGSGTLTDVLPHMTMFIGSTAGAHDKGICRVRKTPAADMFYVSETSDIQFENDDHVTIIDHHGIWPRDIFEVGGVIFMDKDIEFGSSLHGGPFPRIGPLASVLQLTGATVDFQPPLPTLSDVYDGATIVSYTYDAPGASATADMDTDHPTFTYDTAGEYRWSCSILDDQGRVTVAHRRLFINPDQIDFRLGKCVGDFQSNDWSFEVTCSDNVTLSDVYDRAMVVLYARSEYYGNVEGSIGKLAGYENIKCVGWIDGDSIDWDNEGGEVTFTVQGPAFWLAQIRAFPFELLDTSAAPTSWKEIQEMTVDKALAHLLYWNSTAAFVMDCFFTGDTNRKKSFVQPSGSLMDQIKAIANKVFANPLVNNYGQMFVEIDQQLIANTDRNALPVVMDITKEDYLGDRTLDRKPRSRTSMIEISADIHYDGTTEQEVFSRAPGRIGKVFGKPNSPGKFLAADQTELNRIAGDYLAFENGEFEPFEIKLSSNNPLIDIAPRMYCTTTILASENPRGVELVDVRLIPRSVEYVPDHINDVYLTVVTFEVETIGVPGVSYYPIDIGDELPPLDIGDIDDFPIDDIDFPDDPIDVETPCSSAVANSFSLNWDIRDMRGDDPATLSSKAYFPCKIRATGGIYTTSINLPGTWQGDARLHYNVYGFKGGARVITAAITQNKGGNVATFSPLTDTEVDGFEVALEAGLGSELEYEVGDIIKYDTVAATTDYNLDSYSLTVGNYYAVNAWGGPWYPITGYPASYSILVSCGIYSTGVPGIGLRFADASSTIFNLNMGTLGLEARAISSLYGLIIFQATDAAWGVVVDDNVKADNLGSIGYTLRNVTAKGRRILLGGAILHNVCAIE